ncbi:O-antigen ligase family protein [Clostridium paridis]|uniref:O-antigen ligase family protein n=1 Tax=Clostridium paridis TaxID=2803863 RepID=A0A937F9X3_9CLOT|nr:O-antigen ligase family protein [Clostridium paridis]MBL4930260.1 O-antigen ligase family protein [Clostridium paridis]
MNEIKETLAAIKRINNKYLIAILLFSILSEVFLIRKIGIKDSTTFALALALVLFEIILSKEDINRSILLFILSLPVLVTARKVFYLDIKLIILNFESIYIIGIFFLNFKKVKNMLGKYNREKGSSRNLFTYAIFFVMCSYISVIFSPDSMRSFALTTTSVLVPILFMFVLIAVINKKEINRVIIMLILAVNLSCIYGFVQIIKNHAFSFSALKASRDVITFGFHNSNNFVFVILIVYPLLVDALLYKKYNQSNKIIYIISFLLQSLSIFVTFSRGAWLAVILTFVLLLLNKKYIKVFYAFIVLVLATAKWTIPYIMHRGVQGVSLLQNESTMARVQSIVTSIYISIKYPFGVGMGYFTELYKKYVIDGYMILPDSLRSNSTVPNYTMELAHNVLMQISVELGILALILFLLIYGNRIKSCILSYSENKAINASLIIYMFLGVTTGIEFNHKGVVTPTIMYWIIIALSVINMQAKRE